MSLLSDDERRRFHAYCRQQADDTLLIVRQMERISVNSAVSGHLKAKAAAYAIVARDLAEVETVTIGDSGESPAP